MPRAGPAWPFITREEEDERHCWHQCEAASSRIPAGARLFLHQLYLLLHCPLPRPAPAAAAAVWDMRYNTTSSSSGSRNRGGETSALPPPFAWPLGLPCQSQGHVSSDLAERLPKGTQPRCQICDPRPEQRRVGEAARGHRPRRGAAIRQPGKLCRLCEGHMRWPLWAIDRAERGREGAREGNCMHACMHGDLPLLMTAFCSLPHAGHLQPRPLGTQA